MCDMYKYWNLIPPIYKQIIDFMATTEHDWCIADIAKKSGTSRTPVYRLINNTFPPSKDGGFQWEVKHDVKQSKKNM